MESIEATEEVMGSNTQIVKGKRTKRRRQPSTATTMTSSSSEGGGDDHVPISPTTSAELTESTEEEEDMANCLILLAQGGRRIAEDAATTAGKAGLYGYECKTCNRWFPSFQALGGHRASHKKPKATQEENEISGSPTKSLVPYNKSRVHECSVCGSEFSSGQALGGHMRRHRTAASVSQEYNTKQRSILSLDLNLPAPEDDHDREFPKPSSPGAFAFAGKQPLLFAASTLVDCHY